MGTSTGLGCSDAFCLVSTSTLGHPPTQQRCRQALLATLTLGKIPGSVVLRGLGSVSAPDELQHKEWWQWDRCIPWNRQALCAERRTENWKETGGKTLKASCISYKC